MSKTFIKCLEDNISDITLFKNSFHSLAEICEYLGYSSHGRNTAAVTVFCNKNNIDISHFTSNGKPRIKATTKVCLNCGKEFDATGSKLQRKTTCSHLCANTYYKPNKKETTKNTYALAAKNAGMTSCCICGESNLVDIHHIDHDRENNSLDNLAPLCPTHHMYFHRNKEHLIFDKFIEYLDTRNISY